MQQLCWWGSLFEGKMKQVPMGASPIIKKRSSNVFTLATCFIIASTLCRIPLGRIPVAFIKLVLAQDLLSVRIHTYLCCVRIPVVLSLLTYALHWSIAGRGSTEYPFRTASPGDSCNLGQTHPPAWCICLPGMSVNWGQETKTVRAGIPLNCSEEEFTHKRLAEVCPRNSAQRHLANQFCQGANPGPMRASVKDELHDLNTLLIHSIAIE